MVKYVSYDFSRVGDAETSAGWDSLQKVERNARYRGRRSMSDERLHEVVELYKEGKPLGKLTYEQLSWVECVARTEELVVGGRYWISQHWEHTGSFVKILEKSIKHNAAGLPSSVLVEVVESVGSPLRVGETKIMNATQIYDDRNQSSKENFVKSLQDSFLEKSLKNVGNSQL